MPAGPQSALKTEPRSSPVGLRATAGAWLAQPDMGFLAVCSIIFLGSLVAGAVPFFLNLGERHVSLLSAFGAGMLVSTALAVILPEGVEAFHAAEEEYGGVFHLPLSYRQPGGGESALALGLVVSART